MIELSNAKGTNSDSPERRLNCGACPHVQIWDQHSFTVLKIRQSIFAQRKPNGKLRLLVDIRMINTLIANNYFNKNLPVSFLSDAAQHLAGKSLFCKLDCTQAYHCLQMADRRSVEMLAFNFASRTFACERLAQGLT